MSSENIFGALGKSAEGSHSVPELEQMAQAKP